MTNAKARVRREAKRRERAENHKKHRAPYEAGRIAAHNARVEIRAKKRIGVTA